jgi:7-cyano-7-deazaguanine synthase
LERVAVLASGGLDSCVLLADLGRGAHVFPVYVEAGLAWEEEEKRALRDFLAALDSAGVEQPTVLEMPVRSLYGRHWSLTGEGVPDAAAPDREVYLPGRNLLLIGVTAVWCALHGVSRIAIGSLEHNPFPDATPRFFAGYSSLLSECLSHPIEIVAPYRGREKREIIAEFAGLPLHLTLTCMSPRDGLHCGACNKCFERHRAFTEAGVEDATPYLRVPEGV